MRLATPTTKKRRVKRQRMGKANLTVTANDLQVLKRFQPKKKSMIKPRGGR